MPDMSAYVDICQAPADDISLIYSPESSHIRLFASGSPLVPAGHPWVGCASGDLDPSLISSLALWAREARPALRVIIGTPLPVL